jgi:hypothetical protein
MMTITRMRSAILTIAYSKPAIFTVARISFPDGKMARYQFPIHFTPFPTLAKWSKLGAFIPETTQSHFIYH